MLSDIQKTALTLYRKNLNVFPVMLSDIYAKTNCMKELLKVVRRGRMREDNITSAFQGQCQIGIMTGPSSGGLFVVRASRDMYHKLIDDAKTIGIRVWAIPTAMGGELWFRANLAIRTVKAREGVLIKAKDLYERGQEFMLLPETYHNGLFEVSEPPLISRWQMEELELKLGFQHYPDPPLIDADNWLEQQRKYIQKLIAEEGYEANPYNPETKEAIALAKQLYRDRYRNRIRHYAGISMYMAEKWDWSADRVTSDLATLAGLIRIAEKVNTNTVSFHAPQRTVAQYAHLAENTVAAALARFMQAPEPIVDKVEHSYTHEISYNFNRKSVDTGRQCIKKWGENEAYTTDIYRVLTYTVNNKSYWYWTEVYPDLLEKGALEYTGLLIHALLSQKASGMKQAEIVEHLGFTEDVIRRQCNRLENRGLLIHKSGALYCAVPLSNELCQSVITQAGVAGKSEERRLKHARESQDFIGKSIVALREKCDKENMESAHL